MLKSFFSFIQRKILSLGSTEGMKIRETILRALKSKEKRATAYLRYAQALAPYSSKQAEIFTEMGLQELKNYKQLFRLSRNNFSHTAAQVYTHPSFVKNKRLHTQAQTAAAETNQETHDPSKVDRQTILTWIQPGLAGLMDGSVSTLAPIFAAAFATGDTHKTFLIGLSASVGAGLSMGFTEAVHDDGKLSGRGSPLKRGIANGVMTTLGGLGHTLPYLMSSFYIATTIAFIVVFFELWIIAWVQNRFMSIPFWKAALQVIIGGALVFAVGIFIGSI
ncbi:VIT1/CCC1 transporter family protein [Bartonella sp. B30(2025)]